MEGVEWGEWAPPLQRDEEWRETVRYWALLRQSYSHTITSQVLLKVFCYVEDVPLLLILDDFIQNLDQLLLQYENMEENMEKGEREGGEKREEEKEREGGKEEGGKEEEQEKRGDKERERKGEGTRRGGEGGRGGRDMDGQYVALLEMYCLLWQRLYDVQHNWRAIYCTVFSPLGKTAVFAQEHYSRLQPALSSLLSHCSGLMQAVARAGPRGPRLLELATHLQLTETERLALNYIFMQNAGVLFAKLHSRFSIHPFVQLSTFGGSRAVSMATSAAAFAGMTSREMLEFMDGERLLLKQELLEPEDEFSTTSTSQFLKMPPTVLKACCGSVLSAEELYKIDKTAMAEVLAEEERDEADRKTKVMLEHAREYKKELEEKEEKEEEEEEEEEGEKEEKEEGGEEEMHAQTETGAALELEAILKSCAELQQQQVAGQGEGARGEETAGEDRGSGLPQPYLSDLAYLEDQFQLIETLVKARKMETSDDSFLLRPDQRKPEAVVRELRAKGRGLQAKVERKMEATRRNGAWLPRLERLAELRSLDTFEKNVLLMLTGSMVSRNLRDSTGSHGDAIFGHHLSIGSLIGLFCGGLEEQIRSRVYFYKNSRLVSEGLVHVSDPPLHSRGNFLDSVVELDRRLLDYIVGLDTEINELVDGSDLYTPEVTLQDVALPDEHRQLLVNTFHSFDQFQKTCKELKLKTRGIPQGLCLLFYGPSGTGKTMTANAVANHLQKKVLLVTVSVLMEKDLTKDLLRFLFREAKIHNAVLFFDECEMMFESRESRNSSTLGLMLTEIEQYSGIIILATNRHQDLDEAMHRRIQLSLAFSVPDYTLRVDIWKSHVPAAIVGPDVDWCALALSHELTGGLIRNAVLSALSVAIKEQTEGQSILLTQQHLTSGAKLQLRGLLEMVDFDRRVIPTFGLRDLVLDDSTHRQLRLLLNAGKTHKFISAQWGFGGGANVARTQGMVCLLCGRSGAGKSAIAHAIAYELGQPVKEANCTELLAHAIVSSPRASGGRGVAAFFKDAQRANAVVVLDGAEIVLASMAGSLMSGVVGCENYTLAYQIEHFPGVVVLTSRMELGHLDLSRLPNLKYVLELPVPSWPHRAQLWQKLLPQKMPVARGIDYVQLAKRYELTGGDIARVLCSAAEQVATDTSGSTQLTQEQLAKAAEEEVSRRHLSSSPALSIFN